MSGAGFGIYIHWPYCARICPYCDFNVYRARDQDHAPLIAAIITDLREQRRNIGPRQLDTIFFGGGSPSLLAPAEIETMIAALADCFDPARDIEITVEANPEDRAQFAGFTAVGVNRLSIGVQALRDDALAALGRNHDAAAAVEAVEMAARTRARVSIDMIYARAGQSIADWRAELRQALALPAEHFSLYELTIKPDTAFERAVQRGALTPPDDDAAADFYEVTQDECDAAGAPAYEISNHARTPEARARHNLIYWRGGEWLGLGPGAHGRVDMQGQRFETKAMSAPRGYIETIQKHGVGWRRADPMGRRERDREALIMGLRAEGAPKSVVRMENAPTLERHGLISIEEDRICLTRAGRLLADRIALELAP